MKIFAFYDIKDAMMPLTSLITGVWSEFPSQKILIVAPAFLYVKRFFSEFEPRLKILDHNSYVRRDIDSITMFVNGKEIVGKPTGDGSKLVKLTPDVILVLETRSLCIEILDRLLSMDEKYAIRSPMAYEFRRQRLQVTCDSPGL